jgi:hypothetical protein
LSLVLLKNQKRGTLVDEHTHLFFFSKEIF